MTTFYSHSNSEEGEQDGSGSRPRERSGRNPRLFAAGDLKLLLMALIAEQPAHGNELIRQIKSMFDGAYTPSPGVIYPTLTHLETSKMTTADAGAGKKCYSATDSGRLFLEDHAEALAGLRVRIDAGKRLLRDQDRPAEIHEALDSLCNALKSHQGRWSREETLRIRDLLNDTASAIVDGPARPSVSEPSNE